MDLSIEQKKVHDNVVNWLNTRNDDIDTFQIISGFAGTGKTFLLTKIRETLQGDLKYKNIAFCAPTGRAASVLKRKLKDISITRDDFIGTIHSLLYFPKICPITKKIIGWVRKPLSAFNYDLLFVDEASMINLEMWSDLYSLKIPLIISGDKEQLPPVDANDFSIMSKPDYFLTEIQRQAYESPIIKLSEFVRNNGHIPRGMYDKCVFKMNWKEPKCKELFNNISFFDDVIVLCGLNKTRVKLNNIIRSRLGYSREEPYPGEKIICISNNYKLGVMNGQLATVTWITHFDKDLYNLTASVDGLDFLFDGFVYKHSFSKESYEKVFDDLQVIIKRSYKSAKTRNKGIAVFDFGYATSVHKSQGSEWSKVVVVEEGSYYWSSDYYRRWLYTATTRAREKLFIIEGFNDG